jgi:ribosomal protein L31
LIFCGFFYPRIEQAIVIHPAIQRQTLAADTDCEKAAQIKSTAFKAFPFTAIINSHRVWQRRSFAN